MKLSKEERDFLLHLIDDYTIRNLVELVYYDKPLLFVHSLVRKLSSNKDKEIKKNETKS